MQRDSSNNQDPSKSTGARDGEIGNSGSGYKPGGYDKAQPKDRDDLGKEQPAIDGSRGSDERMETSGLETTDARLNGDDRGSDQRKQDEDEGRGFDPDSRPKLSKDWTGGKKS
jgi:hypothetical protein